MADSQVLASSPEFLLRASPRQQERSRLPPSFPGGAAALDAVVSFCFDTRVPVMRPWNVAALRCAAEFLGMDDRYGGPNLSTKADSYLIRVVLRSWPHTLLVLADCYNALLPLSEELGIVGRCLDALATMIVATIGSSNVGDGDGDDDDDKSWWIDDIVNMPGSFFGRMVACLRNKAVCERFIGELIVKWTEMWLFSSKDEKSLTKSPLALTRSRSSSVSSLGSSLDSDCADRCCLHSELQLSCKPRMNFREQATISSPARSTSSSEKLELLEAVAGILPHERAALPIGFLFLLLRYAFAMDSSADCKSQIETRIALQLENATLDDFLLPFKSSSKENCERNLEVDSMKSIVSRFLAQQQRNILSANSEHQLLLRGSPSGGGGAASGVSPNAIHQQQAVCSVARIWDQYLSEIACDGSIAPQKFAELVEVVPAYARGNHDQLYKAIHTFLKSHADATPQERAAVCRALNCLKLSQESCIQAVQNEMMPLRTIVQAMFMQQLQTRNAINSHLRPTGGLIRSPSPIPQQQQQQQQNRLNHFSDKAVIEGIKETNTRLQSLEDAMAQMRKSLRESSATRLGDLFACNDKEVVKSATCDDQDQQRSNDIENYRSSSASSSQHSQRSSSSGGSKDWKKRFLQKLRGARGSGSGSSKGVAGVARVARAFQKMGFCHAGSRNFPENSFNELPYCAGGAPPPPPPASPAGCIPIPALDDGEALKNPSGAATKLKKSSCDDGELVKHRHRRQQQQQQHKKHSRQHSVA